MKRYQLILLSWAFIFPLCHCSTSSDPDPELTKEEKQIEMLAKTWVPESVTHLSEDVTTRFNGFTLTFTKERTYLSTPERGGYNVEPFMPSGTWDFKDDDLNSVIRDDGVLMNMVLSNNSLVLTFLLSDPGGRVAGVGEYRFALSTE